MDRITSQRIRRIALDGVLIALYFVLAMFSLKFGNIRITFASLTIVLSALLYGTADACIIAAAGEFFVQLMTYGFTPTTALWLLPGVVRALVIGMGTMPMRRTEVLPEKHPVVLYILCLTAALLTTLCNTLVIYLDSKLYGYFSFAYVFGDLAMRLLSGIVTAVVITTIVLPALPLLRRAMRR